MGCDEFRELLGRFHDGEAPPAARAAVAAHVSGCAGCAAARAAVAELGELARALPEPEPPGDLWERIAPRLGAAPARVYRSQASRRSAAALAALVLAVLAAGWWAPRPARRGPHPASPGPVVDLGPYLDGPASRPGQWMSPAEAAHRVAFRVLSAPELPDGYCLHGCCLCRGGCCDLVECAYRRGADQLLVVQCGPGQAVAFGGRPVLQTRVHGKPAQVVQAGGRLAASWQVNGSAVSLIGPRDLAELVRLMAHVEERLAAGP
jgi:hypothetical protein